VHRVYSNELYVHEYEFYSPFVNCVLTKNEVIKLKQCYAAIFQKNTSEITVILYYNSHNNMYKNILF
jgi:hypothetical protein